jgi:hypothetical protein
MGSPWDGKVADLHAEKIRLDLHNEYYAKGQRLLNELLPIMSKDRREQFTILTVAFMTACTTLVQKKSMTDESFMGLLKAIQADVINRSR